MTDHETCVAASHAGCSCGALAGRPCTGCATGWYHLSRFARARASRLLTGAQFARVIQDDATGFTAVHDPGIAS